MKNMILLIAALLIFMPGAALAGSDQSFEESQKRYLQTANEYREKANELSAEKDRFSGAQQAIIGDLVDVYIELAEIKEGLAAAIGARNWDKEEKLEMKYYALKDEDEKLWDDLERSKS